MDINAIVREAAKLRTDIAIMRERLKVLQDAILVAAQFAPGSMTGHLVTGEYSVKVNKKETVKWDQEKLENLRKAIGNEKFLEGFQYSLEPRPRIFKSWSLSQNKDLYDAIVECRTVTDATPYITYESLSEVE